MQVPESVSTNAASNNVTKAIPSAGKNAAKIHFLFLNLGHFLDHFFKLFFSRVEIESSETSAQVRVLDYSFFVLVEYLEDVFYGI